MDKQQLEQFITETLKNVDLYHPNAVKLLLGTAAQESACGKYIKQLGNGPALGIFQMEPDTFVDIMHNYLHYHDDLKKEILHECNIKYLVPSILQYNLKAAVCFARLQYYRRPEPLPTNLVEMAVYWKQYYNTVSGKGAIAEFIHNYKKYIKNQ